MTNERMDIGVLQQKVTTQREIEAAIIRWFALEDDGLRHALTSAKEANLPEIQISPIQGRLLQILAVACNAQKILEIGSLAGYSGIWLARALPAGGHLITLEINPRHAEIAQKNFAVAGVGDCTELRVGNALDLLSQLENEGPFDLVFIDADKPSYPQYLDWALRLTRPGSFIVADNCIRSGEALREPEQLEDTSMAALARYNKRVVNNPRLMSLALAMDDSYTDGLNIAVVLKT